MQAPLILQLIVATFCRFLLKTGRRFLYPFATVVSVGLGVSLAAVTALLAVNQVAALLSPLFGPLSDRWGYRTMMGIGLGLASICMLAVGILPRYEVLMLGLFAIGIGISICDPALQAYVGVKVPFAQRGRVIGLTEMSWAASSLIGIPVAGLLINAYSWSTPFVVMGLLGLVGAVLLRWILPPDIRSNISIDPQLLLSACRPLFKQGKAQATLLCAFLVSCANDIFFVAYGLWLVENFNMGLVALGLATTVIGLAELSGELLAVSLADRIGLRRTVLITLGATVLCYAFLPLWGFSVTGALIGIFLLCLAFEFNFVAMISWTTEVYPTARATMMSSFQAASGLGHVCGVVTGGLIWLTGGIAGVGIVCAALCALGFIVIHRELHYRELHLREQHQYHQLPVAHRAKSSSKSGHCTAAEVVVHYQAWCQHVW